MNMHAKRENFCEATIEMQEGLALARHWNKRERVNMTVERVCTWSVSIEHCGGWVIIFSFSREIGISMLGEDDHLGMSGE